MTLSYSDHRRPALVFGAVLAAIIGVAYGIGLYELFRLRPGGYLTLSFLLGVPIAAPTLALLIWDYKTRFSSLAHILFGASVVSSMLVAGIFLLSEGGICVLMAAPVFYISGMFGPWLAGSMLRHFNSRVLSIGLVLLPPFGLSTEQYVSYPTSVQTVKTTIDIAASPIVVWRNLTSVRHIVPSELEWTFTHNVVGVPKPVDAYLVGEGPGAIRYASWGSEIHFEEHIIRWRPNQELVWRFQFNDHSIPESLEGNVRINGKSLRVAQGSYTLSSLRKNFTRLTLSTSYIMRTPLNWYCALWGRLFIGDFHHNILRVVRERAERSLHARHRTLNST